MVRWRLDRRHACLVPRRARQGVAPLAQGPASVVADGGGIADGWMATLFVMNAPDSAGEGVCVAGAGFADRVGLPRGSAATRRSPVYRSRGGGKQDGRGGEAPAGFVAILSHRQSVRWRTRRDAIRRTHFRPSLRLGRPSSRARPNEAVRPSVLSAAAAELLGSFRVRTGCAANGNGARAAGKRRAAGRGNPKHTAIAANPRADRSARAGAARPRRNGETPASIGNRAIPSVPRRIGSAAGRDRPTPVSPCGWRARGGRRRRRARRPAGARGTPRRPCTSWPCC